MKNWMDIEYKAQNVETGLRVYFQSKRRAIEFGRTQGGDWDIIRIWWGGREQKIKTVGGWVDDWPDYDEDEDY